MLSITPAKLIRMDGLSFGEWLEVTFTAAGFNQTTFAEALGYKQPTVSGWVTGKKKMTSRKACLLIAAALGIDPDCVFRRAGIQRRIVTDEELFSDPEKKALYDRLPPEDQRLVYDLMRRAAERAED